VVLPPGKFLVTKQLKIRPGVTLMGQGIGTSPTAQDPDKGGSTILYCGNDYAVRMLGDNAALEKVAITDHRGKS
jgi:predicted TIM-barrel enzyme